MLWKNSLVLTHDAFRKLPRFLGAHSSIIASGHSIKDYINHCDELVIKKLSSDKSIMYGEPNVVVTKADNIITVKFLKQCYEVANCISLVQYNIEQFEPKDISKDDILEV